MVRVQQSLTTAVANHIYRVGVGKYSPCIFQESCKITSINTDQRSSRAFCAAAAKSKKKKKKDGVSKLEEGSKKDPHIQMVIRCLDAPHPPKPRLTDEQKEKHYNAGRNHVIGRFKEHNERYHDLACKLKLKHHAMNMLPKDEGTVWREKALFIDTDIASFPPLWRQIPTDFPPIPGFDPEQFIEEDR